MNERHVTSADGTRIAYDRQGAGPLLLLVGGAFSGRGDGAGLAALLAGRFTVICFDRRGRGGSADTQPYAVAREVEDIAALLAIAPGGAVVYGHSSGAVLALHAALALPRLISKLALYEPPFIVDDSRAPMPTDLPTRLNAALAAGDRDAAAALFLTEAVGVPAGALPYIRQGPHWPGQMALAHTLPYELAVLGDMAHGAAPLARFAGVHAHALVIDGGASAPWAHHGADAIAAALPHAARSTLAGQGHGVDPAVLAPVLLEWFGAG